MEITSLIQDILQGNKSFLQNDSIMKSLSNNQSSVIKLLHVTLSDDKYLEVTQQLWKILEEDDIGLIKFDLYCHVLKQSQLQSKTARYICLKERNMKTLNTSLLSHCGSHQAIDFLMQAYDLPINNIIEGVAHCYFDAQIPIMEHLLTRLNDGQKNSALNKFISAYLEDYPKEINLVSFVLKQKQVWNKEVLENEKIKKLMFFNKIEEKLPQQNNKTKARKI